MRIEKVAVEQHHFIQLIHLCPNPILDITSMRKSQLTWSKAFSMSILRRRPDLLSFNLESRASLAIRTASRIFSHGRKLAANQKSPLPSLISAYLLGLWPAVCTLPTRLIGLKSLRSSAPSFLGMSKRNVEFKLLWKVPWS